MVTNLSGHKTSWRSLHQRACNPNLNCQRVTIAVFLSIGISLQSSPKMLRGISEPS